MRVLKDILIVMAIIVTSPTWAAPATVSTSALASTDVIERGDIRYYMDGKAGRPTLAQWRADNSTNVARAINAAIAAAAETTKEVMIPAGNYTVTSTIAMMNGVNIKCFGNIHGVGTSTIINFTNISGAKWIGGNISGDNVTDLQSAFVLTNASNNEITVDSITGVLNKGVAILGQSGSGTSATNNHIKVGSISGATGTWGAGISIFGDTATSNIVIGGNYTGNRIGISINGAHSNTFYGPQCSNNTSIGFTIDGIVSGSGDGGTHNKIYGLVANHNQGVTYGNVYLGNGSSYNEFYGVTANGGIGAGLRMSGGAANQNIGNIFVGAVISGNAANGITLSHSPETELIAVSSLSNVGRGIGQFNSDYMRVMGGKYSNNTSDGLLIQSAHTKVLDAEITGNNGYGYRVASGGASSNGNNFIGGGTHVVGNATEDVSIAAGLGRFDSTITGNPPATTVTAAADSNFNWAVGSPTTIIYNTPISALRSVSLSTTNAKSGDKVRVVRNPSSTGAYPVNVGTGPLAALSAGSWCDVEYNGSAWFLSAYGTEPTLSGTTGSIGGRTVAAGACISGTATVTGATKGMAVIATPTIYPGDGVAPPQAYVSSTNTVTVKVCGIVAVTPVATTYNVRVLR